MNYHVKTQFKKPEKSDTKIVNLVSLSFHKPQCLRLGNVSLSSSQQKDVSRELFYQHPVKKYVQKKSTHKGNIVNPSTITHQQHIKTTNKTRGEKKRWKVINPYR